jgi:hypothetical protein
MRFTYPAALAFALAGSACAHPPKPYTFTLDQPKDAVDIVVRALAANGLNPAVVDRSNGTITTRWTDTGYRFRDIGDIDNGSHVEYDTNVFLRYKVSLTGSNGQQTVTLDTDVQRCSPTDSVITAAGVNGSCLPMTIVFPTQQKQVDDLGAKLKLALAGDKGAGG